MAGFGSLACEDGLVGEAGPDFVGEAGLTGGADGGHGTVWCPGQRRVVSWRVSLSRAVFWRNRQADHQLNPSNL